MSVGAPGQLYFGQYTHDQGAPSSALPLPWEPPVTPGRPMPGITGAVAAAIPGQGMARVPGRASGLITGRPIGPIGG